MCAKNISKPQVPQRQQEYTRNEKENKNSKGAQFFFFLCAKYNTNHFFSLPLFKVNNHIELHHSQIFFHVFNCSISTHFKSYYARADCIENKQSAE